MMFSYKTAKVINGASQVINGASQLRKRYLATSTDLVKTALNDLHKELGGDMVPFAGYELPVLYKGDGVMKEHLWCRSEGKASLFDVSHMGQVRISSHCQTCRFLDILALTPKSIDPLARKRSCRISRTHCSWRYCRTSSG